MPLFPGMQLFQRQEQTADFQKPGESYYNWLKRKIAQALAISKENQGGFLPPPGTSVNPQIQQVDQNFRPIPQPSGMQQIDQMAGQVANLSPLKNLPPYASRINEWAQMKTSPNQPQAPQMPALIPPDEANQGMGAPPVLAPMPQPMVPPPPVQEQAPQQASFDPAMLAGLMNANKPMSFQDYWKSMQEMQPQREKGWMDSPMYPFSMAMLGLGQNLMTPQRFRGFNQNTFAPMMQALAMQAQNKQKGDNRALFEKSVASYPQFIQATRPQKQDWNFAWNPETKQFTPLPGSIHNLPQDKAHYGITIGPNGAEQIINLPPGNYTTLPSAKQKETPPQVVGDFDEASGTWNWTNVPQGMKSAGTMKRTRDPMAMFQQNQQNQKQGPLIKATNKRTGQVEYITLEEARRRGMR